MAKMFNPGNHKGGGGDGKESSWLSVAGDYMLVISSLDRDVARSGKPYLATKMRVIDGPMKGKRFEQRLYLNDESLWKLGLVCEAQGYDGEFDLESVKSCREALVGRPFKATVSVRSGDSRKFAELKSCTPWEQLSGVEQKKMDQWQAEEAARREVDSSSFSDDDPMSGQESPSFSDDYF